MKWYQFKPSDTLFFRGAEPMIAGMDYETVLSFPPSVSVISGAIRTAVLAQQGISINAYKSGSPVSERIGAYGGNAPFDVVGPLIRYEGDDFVPAPYTWYYEVGNPLRKINIKKPFVLGSDIRQKLGLKTSTGLMNWVMHENEVKSIGGSWLALKGLLENRDRFEVGKSIFMPARGLAELFAIEARTGIEIDAERNVAESQLYSSRHIRLNANVSLIWGIDRDCGLDKKGVLSLGGERRFGAYGELDQIPDFPESGDQYLCLSPVPVNEQSITALIGTGEIVYRGGWDLAEQFHKDMMGYYPVGSVFSKNINQCCVPFLNGKEGQDV